MSGREDNHIAAGALIAIVLAAALTLLTAFCSCTRTVYQTVETVREHSDTLRIVQQRVDSVRLLDSVFILQHGDTVVINHYRDRVQIRTVTDTMTRTVIKTDSIAVPYPVERELTRWQQTKQNYGGVAILAVVVAFAIAVGWLSRRFRQ